MQLILLLLSIADVVVATATVAAATVAASADAVSVAPAIVADAPAHAPASLVVDAAVAIIFMLLLV